MTKLWDKGYELNAAIESFTVGNDPELDQILVYYDCIASKAHAKMLGIAGLLTKLEVDDLLQELDHIIALDKNGKFIIRTDQEDCHTAIEMFLTDALGDVGKKIHTARSRNDQVLTALRLYYKDQFDGIIKLINDLIEAIRGFVNTYGNIQFPGYTHMRKAMPSSIRMWSNAFIDSMNDNLDILSSTRHLIDQSPLGTAAGYGVPLNIDREFAAEELGFTRVQNNPIYAQISRGKFEISILHVLTQIMFDINKLASDLILFSMPEFGYFELPDEFCTGSSIMPQKKNPDVLELLRAKYHLLSTYIFQVSGISSNLISGYNRDIQLTKEPTIRGFEITNDSLNICIFIFKNLRVKEKNCKKAMTKELFSTEEVFSLVQNGIPFREAYKIISRKY